MKFAANVCCWCSLSVFSFKGVLVYSGSKLKWPPLPEDNVQNTILTDEMCKIVFNMPLKGGNPSYMTRCSILKGSLIRGRAIVLFIITESETTYH